MRKYKNIFLIILCLMSMTCITACHKKGNSRVSNDEALADKDHRYLTIINDTDRVINRVDITVGEGMDIDHAYQKNPDEKSFSVLISDDYKDYTTFTITLTTVNDIQYRKVMSHVKEKGVTEVKMTKDDCIDNDLPSLINDFFN